MAPDKNVAVGVLPSFGPESVPQFLACHGSVASVGDRGSTNKMFVADDQAVHIYPVMGTDLIGLRAFGNSVFVVF